MHLAHMDVLKENSRVEELIAAEELKAYQIKRHQREKNKELKQLKTDNLRAL